MQNKDLKRIGRSTELLYKAADLLLETALESKRDEILNFHEEILRTRTRIITYLQRNVDFHEKVAPEVVKSEVKEK